MATWDDVRAVALALPEVEERDGPEWRVGSGRAFVFDRPLRRRDLDELGTSAPTGTVVGLRTGGLDAKEELLAADPGVWFATAHLDGYPMVLGRLDAVDPADLTGLLQDAWLAVAPKRLAKLHFG
jgi:hypothetical protein